MQYQLPGILRYVLRNFCWSDLFWPLRIRVAIRQALKSLLELLEGSSDNIHHLLTTKIRYQIFIAQPRKLSDLILTLTFFSPNTSCNPGFITQREKVLGNGPAVTEVLPGCLGCHRATALPRMAKAESFLSIKTPSRLFIFYHRCSASFPSLALSYLKALSTLFISMLFEVSTNLSFIIFRVMKIHFLKCSQKAIWNLHIEVLDSFKCSECYWGQREMMELNCGLLSSQRLSLGVALWQNVPPHCHLSYLCPSDIPAIVNLQSRGARHCTDFQVKVTFLFKANKHIHRGKYIKNKTF